MKTISFSGVVRYQMGLILLTALGAARMITLD